MIIKIFIQIANIIPIGVSLFIAQICINYMLIRDNISSCLIMLHHNGYRFYAETQAPQSTKLACNVIFLIKGLPDKRNETVDRGITNPN